MPYVYKEYPRTMHKWPEQTITVRDDEEKARALEAGWALLPQLEAPAPAVTDEGVAALSIAKLIQLVEATEDVATLEEYRAEEMAGKNRTGALKALDAKIALLSPDDDEGDDRE